MNGPHLARASRWAGQGGAGQWGWGWFTDEYMTVCSKCEVCDACLLLCSTLRVVPVSMYVLVGLCIKRVTLLVASIRVYICSL